MEDARVSNKHYAAIGLVAARWSYFEATVDGWISAFLRRPPEVTVCLTGQMMAGSTTECVHCIGPILDAREKWNQVLEEFATDATGLRSKGTEPSMTCGT